MSYDGRPLPPSRAMTGIVIEDSDYLAFFEDDTRPFDDEHFSNDIGTGSIKLDPNGSSTQDLRGEDEVEAYNALQNLFTQSQDMSTPSTPVLDTDTEQSADPLTTPLSIDIPIIRLEEFIKVDKSSNKTKSSSSRQEDICSIVSDEIGACFTT